MRLTALALSGAALFLALPSLAQQPDFSAPQSLYIDGRTPVDQRTRDLVDAYLIYKEQLDREEAERRERFELFIYQDNIHSEHPFGRY